MRWIIIGLVVAVYLFETFVARLNQKQSRKPIPKLVKDVYDQERYKKWLAYFLEGHKFGLVQQGFSLIVLLVLLFGPLANLERLVSTWTNHPILQSLIFLGIYQTLLVLLGIPFRFYRTFSIEERHGFNRTTKKIFFRDLLMSYFLTLILGGLVVGCIHALFLYFSENLWAFIFATWASLSFLMLVVVAFLNKLFLRLFNKFTPLPAGELRTRIEELASSLGFSLKSILVMDASKRSTKSNAAFTGIGKSREIILFDTLLENMSNDEVMAVLAHELGHAIHKDTWRLLVQNIFMVGLYVVGIGLVLESPSLFTAFGFPGVHFGFATILFSILLEPISLLFGIPLNYLSRQAEYKADAFAAKYTDPTWLVSALKVLSRQNLTNLNPHPLVVFLYHSHPAMNERIKALQQVSFG